MRQLPLLLVIGAAAAAQDAPEDRERVPLVKTVQPPCGATDVDPSVKEIRITFDMAMSPEGYSLVGGGPHFPSVAGDPRWADAYTFVLPVSLRTDWEYRFSINSDQHKNFRSVWLVPAEPTFCRFTTGGAKAIQRNEEQQRDLNIESFDALTSALRNKYSYFELRDVDWEQHFVRHRREIVSAESVAEWARRTARMLAAAKDMHMWLELDGETIATYQRSVPANYDLDRIRMLVPNLHRLNMNVWTGETQDGIACLMIKTWSRAAATDIGQARRYLENHANAPAMVIDVRPNSGGDETLARSIASWFVSRKHVYAKHTYRRGPASDDFTPIRERVIEPNEPERRYRGPVAVLMGPRNMSSCEAFLLMMKQAERATLFGEMSFGSSGNPAPTYLPNGVKVLIPSWRALTPDGECFEGKGIAPDVRVQFAGTDPETPDPVLKKALEHLRREVHSTEKEK